MQRVMDISDVTDRLSTAEEIRKATMADPGMPLQLSRRDPCLREDWNMLEELESLSAEDLESYLDLLEGQGN